MYEIQIKLHVFQLDLNFEPKQFDYGIVPTTMKTLMVEQYNINNNNYKWVHSFVQKILNFKIT